MMHLKGQGVPQDYVEAVMWFHRAAEQGAVFGQLTLGALYFYGEGVVPQDYTVAAKWYRKAAEQGQELAQFRLGEMYRDGLGVPQDYAEAHMWFNLAAAQGQDDADVGRDEVATHATGTAEREATLTMLDRQKRGGGERITPRITLGAGKAYDVTDFVNDLRQRKVTPHIAVNGAVSKLGKARKTAIDRRTTRHPGYAVSQRIHKRVEEVFGCVKSQAGFDQVKVRGRQKAEAVFTFATAAYNLIRIPRLLAEAAG